MAFGQLQKKNNPIHLKKTTTTQFPVKQNKNNIRLLGTSPASKTVSPWPKTFLSLEQKQQKPGKKIGPV